MEGSEGETNLETKLPKLTHMSRAQILYLGVPKYNSKTAVLNMCVTPTCKTSVWANCVHFTCILDCWINVGIVSSSQQ